MTRALDRRRPRRAPPAGRCASPFAATGVSIDTRTLRPGDLFVALAGETATATPSSRDALARGAAGALVHRHLPDARRRRAAAVVDDTLAGLRALARFARARFTGRLVAVTGSVGKTTTKEMLRTILAAQGRTHAAEASYNNHWGVPLTLARLPPDAAFCVAEIGMNHAGEIAPLARLARPHVALITPSSAPMSAISAASRRSPTRRPRSSRGSSRRHRRPARDTPLLARLRAARRGTGRSSPSAPRRAPMPAARPLRRTPMAREITRRVAGRTLRFRLPAPGRHMAMNARRRAGRRRRTRRRPGARRAALESFTPVAGRGAQRASRCPAAPRCCSTKATTPPPPRCAPPSPCCACSPPRAASPCWATCWNSASKAPPSTHRWRPTSTAADLLFACGPLMQQPVRCGARRDPRARTPPTPPRSLHRRRAVAPGDAVLIKGSLGSRMKLIVAAIETVAETR